YRSRIAARSASGTRRQVCCVLRASRTAATTSFSLDTGRSAIGCPVAGAYDVLVPAVARSSPDNRRMTDWSVAYDAVGSSSGSAGIDVCSLICLGYLPVIDSVSIRSPLSSPSGTCEGVERQDGGQRGALDAS